MPYPPHRPPPTTPLLLTHPAPTLSTFHCHASIHLGRWAVLSQLVCFHGGRERERAGGGGRRQEEDEEGGEGGLVFSSFFSPFIVVLQNPVVHAPYRSGSKVGKPYNLSPLACLSSSRQRFFPPTPRHVSSLHGFISVFLFLYFFSLFIVNEKKNNITVRVQRRGFLCFFFFFFFFFFFDLLSSSFWILLFDSRSPSLSLPFSSLPFPSLPPPRPPRTETFVFHSFSLPPKPPPQKKSVFRFSTSKKISLVKNL